MERRPSSPNLAPFQAKYRDRSRLVQYANRQFLRTIDSLVASAKPKTVLDAGCGEGMTLQYLQPRSSFRAVGLDLDPARLQLGAADPATPPLVCGNGEELPFPDGAFEMVMVLEVLEHVGRPERALREAHRVCTRYLLASVPNEPWWHIGNLLRLKYVRQLGNTPEHINHWTLPGFKRFVGRHFRVTKIATPVLWTVLLAEKLPAVSAERRNDTGDRRARDRAMREG